ncbi:P-loop containing nucleoside triphosphate hydrolase protein [Diplogelasinospora grovesii]|uniref:P-loop containing nucleoside triphosphate hydrolase protein n=1 Tax=Diplogelasinospora grovesii TaxID=303347 RepID=A0AAN6NHX3_9PEZI|nr:P-loop containing nucleoside triphosphate hydrolase protein [Diplogelasinospora grovesii]
MTDLLRVLPHFAVGQYANLIPALEKQKITTSELLVLDAAEIRKRTQLPLLEIKRLRHAVLNALHADLGVPTGAKQHDVRRGQTADARGAPPPAALQVQGTRAETGNSMLKHTHASLVGQSRTITTLDDTLDRALGGGIPTGYITEITGESGAGKTQFLLTLLLAVQLPPELGGLGRPALYISTEAPLSTRRLSQMLTANPLFKSIDKDFRPSLDNIISTATPDLESQDHILTFQVPVEVERRNIGLVVLDSVAANYRAEFDRSADPLRQQGQAFNMGARSTELVRLGMQLHELARKHNLAVVVANQVADRFGGGGSKTPSSLTFPFRHHYAASPAGGQESPLAKRSRASAAVHVVGATVEPSSSVADLVPRSSVEDEVDEDERTRPNIPPPPEWVDDDGMPKGPPPAALALDHQQRWFTGWGDDPYADYSLKTPSLGLVWTTQIAARIALLKRPAYGPSKYIGDEDAPVTTLRSWKRWMKIVFAPHAPASGHALEEASEQHSGASEGNGSGAVEFEVTMGGIRAVTQTAGNESS